MSSRQSHLTPFVLPVAGSLLLAATAPVFREIVKRLQEALGSGFVPFFGTLFVVAGATIIPVALLRIRERRLARYTATGLALLMVALPVVLSDRGTPSEAAVERLHFILYGLLTLLFYRAFARTGYRRWTPVLAFVAVALAGLLDEWVQWAVALRTGEMFDVALNVYSGLCGVVLAFGLIPMPRPAPRTAPRGRAVLVSLLLLLLLAAAAFVEVAHLGHAIDEPEVGGFRSQFSRQRLLETNARRAKEWRVRPPNRPYRSYELQDHFEVEAGWRVKHRNEAYHAGDARTAWKENQLLERYYSSFLALDEMHPGRFSFQLPSAAVEQLRDQQPATEVERYQSRADRGRIWLRPSRPCPEPWATWSIRPAGSRYWSWRP